MEVSNEISLKIRTAIKAKLKELGIFIGEDELPDYVMVMVANKRSEEQMIEDLGLFLGDSTEIFTSWLHGLLARLQSVTSEPITVMVKPLLSSDQSSASASDSEFSFQKKARKSKPNSKSSVSSANVVKKEKGVKRRTSPIADDRLNANVTKKTRSATDSDSNSLSIVESATLPIEQETESEPVLGVQESELTLVPLVENEPEAEFQVETAGQNESVELKLETGSDEMPHVDKVQETETLLVIPPGAPDLESDSGAAPNSAVEKTGSNKSPHDPSVVDSATRKETLIEGETSQSEPSGKDHPYSVSTADAEINTCEVKNDVSGGPDVIRDCVKQKSMSSNEENASSASGSEFNSETKKVVLSPSAGESTHSSLIQTDADGQNIQDNTSDKTVEGVGAKSGDAVKDNKDTTVKLTFSQEQSNSKSSLSSADTCESADIAIDGQMVKTVEHVSSEEQANNKSALSGRSTKREGIVRDSGNGKIVQCAEEHSNVSKSALSGMKKEEGNCEKKMTVEKELSSVSETESELSERKVKAETLSVAENNESDSRPAESSEGNMRDGVNKINLKKVSSDFQSQSAQPKKEKVKTPSSNERNRKSDKTLTELSAATQGSVRDSNMPKTDASKHKTASLGSDPLPSKPKPAAGAKNKLPVDKSAESADGTVGQVAATVKPKDASSISEKLLQQKMKVKHVSSSGEKSKQSGTKTPQPSTDKVKVEDIVKQKCSDNQKTSDAAQRRKEKTKLSSSGDSSKESHSKTSRSTVGSQDVPKDNKEQKSNPNNQKMTSTPTVSDPAQAKKEKLKLSSDEDKSKSANSAAERSIGAKDGEEHKRTKSASFEQPLPHKVKIKTSSTGDKSKKPDCKSITDSQDREKQKPAKNASSASASEQPLPRKVTVKHSSSYVERSKHTDTKSAQSILESQRVTNTSGSEKPKTGQDESSTLEQPLPRKVTVKISSSPGENRKHSNTKSARSAAESQGIAKDSDKQNLVKDVSSASEQPLPRKVTIKTSSSAGGKSKSSDTKSVSGVGEKYKSLKDPTSAPDQSLPQKMKFKLSSSAGDKSTLSQSSATSRSSVRDSEKQKTASIASDPVQVRKEKSKSLPAVQDKTKQSSSKPEKSNSSVHSGKQGTVAKASPASDREKERRSASVEKKSKQSGSSSVRSNASTSDSDAISTSSSVSRKESHSKPVSKNSSQHAGDSKPKEGVASKFSGKDESTSKTKKDCSTSKTDIKQTAGSIHKDSHKRKRDSTSSSDSVAIPNKLLKPNPEIEETVLPKNSQESAMLKKASREKSPHSKRISDKPMNVTKTAKGEEQHLSEKRPKRKSSVSSDEGDDKKALDMKDGEKLIIQVPVRKDSTDDSSDDSDSQGHIRRIIKLKRV